MTGVALNGRRGAGPRRKRTVSTRVKDAILHAIADPKSDWGAAAAQAGLTKGSLVRALREPGPQAFLAETVRSLRSGLAIKAVKKLETLLDTAQSEYVQAETARYLADRVAPPSAPPPAPGSITIIIGDRPLSNEGPASSIVVESTAEHLPVHESAT